MTAGNSAEALVDWNAFSAARAELGANLVRILGYFREDGTKSVAAIEEAMRTRSAALMVAPAHKLKGESAQFGAEPLSRLAETIEGIARDCVETRDEPAEALHHVVALRPLFQETLAVLEREANPLVERRPAAFGARRMGAAFGR